MERYVHIPSAAALSPRTIDELRRLIDTATGSLHAVGTRHSLNDVADAVGIVSLEALPGDVVINQDERTVEVPAATRYGDLAQRLQDAGLALSNLPSGEV